MLEDRQLIGIVGDSVDQLVSHPGLDIAAKDPGRPDDGCLELVTAEARREVLTAIDRLGQFEEAHAVAEKVGAHRQANVDPRVGCSAGRQEQVDEPVGLIRRRLGPGPVAEDLLELVDEDKEVEGAVSCLPGAGVLYEVQEAQLSTP